VASLVSTGDATMCFWNGTRSFGCGKRDLVPDFQSELHQTSLGILIVVCVYAGLNAVRTPWRHPPICEKQDQPFQLSCNACEACSGSKFAVSRAREAYDAQARGPNRKFRFNPSAFSIVQFLRRDLVCQREV
jgi:hypothetical protein